MDRVSKHSGLVFNKEACGMCRNIVNKCESFIKSFFLKLADTILCNTADSQLKGHFTPKSAGLM